MRNKKDSKKLSFLCVIRYKTVAAGSSPIGSAFFNSNYLDLIDTMTFLSEFNRDPYIPKPGRAKKRSTFDF